MSAKKVEAKKEKPVILIGVPTLGSIKTPVITRIMELMMKYNRCELFFSVDKPIGHNRNKIAKAFLDNKKFDYLFFLDDDTIPPVNILDMLLELDTPVATGYYACCGSGELDKTYWSFGNFASEEDLKQGKGYMMLYREKPEVPVTADVGAMGCSLIHRSVFDNLEFPWFQDYYIDNDPNTHTHEDSRFFINIKKNGIRCVIHPEAVCGHLRPCDLTGIHYFNLQKESLMEKVNGTHLLEDDTSKEE